MPENYEYNGKKVAKPRIGRPSKYHPDFCQIAFRACLNGATDEELGSRFNVEPSTIYRWMKAHQEFRSAVQSGKNEADDKVAEALYSSATGYSHPETKFFVVNGEVVREHTIKHYEPNFNSIRLWLLNRRRNVWRDNSDVTVHKVDDETKTDEQIDARINELERRRSGGIQPPNDKEREATGET